MTCNRSVIPPDRWDEAFAAEYLEWQRWGDSPSCPCCGATAVYRMRDRSGQRRQDFRWRCRSCLRQYSVRTGTPIEASRVPLRVWCRACWARTTGEQRGFAAALARESGITYKSAISMRRRMDALLGERWGRRLANEFDLFIGALEVELRRAPESSDRIRTAIGVLRQLAAEAAHPGPRRRRRQAALWPG